MVCEKESPGLIKHQIELLGDRQVKGQENFVVPRHFTALDGAPCNEYRRRNSVSLKDRESMSVDITITVIESYRDGGLRFVGIQEFFVDSIERNDPISRAEEAHLRFKNFGFKLRIERHALRSNAVIAQNSEFRAMRPCQ